jgi:hypothetical protein
MDIGAAFAEALVVNLHVVDRVAFEQLGSERRTWLIDPLISEVASRLAAMANDDAEAAETSKEFLELYSSRATGYSSCSLISEDASDASNTIG